MFVRTILTVIAVLNVFLSSQAFAGDCEEKWPPDSGPQFSCVTLTNELLVGLEGATVAQVRETLHARGAPVDSDRLRFLIPIGTLNGYVIVGLEDDRAVYISAILDHDVGIDEDHPKTTPAHFIWRKDLYFCSDLPGSNSPQGVDCNRLQDFDNQSSLARALTFGTSKAIK
jgi:hypothetical protein